MNPSGGHESKKRAGRPRSGMKDLQLLQPFPIENGWKNFSAVFQWMEKIFSRGNAGRKRRRGGLKRKDFAQKDKKETKGQLVIGRDVGVKNMKTASRTLKGGREGGLQEREENCYADRNGGRDADGRCREDLAVNRVGIGHSIPNQGG